MKETKNKNSYFLGFTNLTMNKKNSTTRFHFPIIFVCDYDLPQQNWAHLQSSQEGQNFWTFVRIQTFWPI